MKTMKTNNDGVFGNDPTPVFIADLGIAKEIVGVPTLLDNNNYSVVYQVVVENIGTTDLENLSLVEDLAAQFGAAFIDAADLTMVHYSNRRQQQYHA